MTDVLPWVVLVFIGILMFVIGLRPVANTTVTPTLAITPTATSSATTSSATST